jgi:biotin carboxyl carrier protein
LESFAEGFPVKTSEMLIRSAERSHSVSFLSPDRVVLDGKEYQVDVRIVAPDRLSLILGNAVYRVDIARRHVENSADELEVTVRGRTIRLSPQDRRTQLLQSIARSRPARADEASILAPMPGLVSRILTTPGIKLGAGAGILILEAMKMENEIRSPSSGTVKEFKVIPGQTVEKNQLLAVFSIDAI